MTWIDHFVIFVFGIVFPLFSLRNARSNELNSISFNTMTKKLFYYSNGLVLWAITLVVLLVHWWQGRSFSLLGLQLGHLPFSGFAWLLMLVFVILYALDVFFELGTDQWKQQTKEHIRDRIGFLPTNSLEFIHFTPLAITAGFCEEVVFRGYFIYYVESLLVNTELDPLVLFWTIIFLPALMFSLSHIYQGGRAILKILVMALLFGAFFLETRTIFPLIIAHIVVDLLAGLFSWRLSRQD